MPPAPTRRRSTASAWTKGRRGASLWEGVSVGYYKLSRALRASLETQKFQVASGRVLKDKLVDVSLQLRAALGQKKADDAAIAELTKATHHAKTTFAKARRNAEVAEEVVDALSEEAEVLREKLLALHKANVDAESHARWRDQRRTARCSRGARGSAGGERGSLDSRGSLDELPGDGGGGARRRGRGASDALPPPDLAGRRRGRARRPTAAGRASRSRADDPWRLSRRAAAPPKPTTPFDEFKRARGVLDANEGGRRRRGRSRT